MALFFFFFEEIVNDSGNQDLDQRDLRKLEELVYSWICGSSPWPDIAKRESGGANVFKNFIVFCRSWVYVEEATSSFKGKDTYIYSSPDCNTWSFVQWIVIFITFLNTGCLHLGIKISISIRTLGIYIIGDLNNKLISILGRYFGTFHIHRIKAINSDNQHHKLQVTDIRSHQERY